MPDFKRLAQVTYRSSEMQALSSIHAIAFFSTLIVLLTPGESVDYLLLDHAFLLTNGARDSHLLGKALLTIQIPVNRNECNSSGER